jgi:mannose-1-phosphate guanylyltransferase
MAVTINPHTFAGQGEDAHHRGAMPFLISPHPASPLPGGEGARVLPAPTIAQHAYVPPAYFGGGKRKIRYNTSALRLDRIPGLRATTSSVPAGEGSVSETALQHHELYAVIMAGGQGTRFWPRSRRRLPKQLLNIVGEATMLEQTVARISPLIPAERTLVVAGDAYRDPIRACLPQLPAENFLFEPVGRNTAACVAWAALWIRQRTADAVMAVLAADHLIRDAAEFLRVLQVAAIVARPLNRLVTIGIQPSHPETGYGYIRASEERLQVGNRAVFRVAQFVEKPSRQKAEEFLAAGTYVWNSGMFVWRADSIWHELSRYLPRLAHSLAPIAHITAADTLDDVLNDVYPQLPAVSIDVGVMERAQDVWVVPADIGWSDVGSWRALSELLDANAHGNVVIGEQRGIDTTGCFIHSPNKLVATIGLNNLVVIETDDVLLICPKERDQDVRKLVELLEREGRHDLL